MTAPDPPTCLACGRPLTFKARRGQEQIELRPQEEGQFPPWTMVELLRAQLARRSLVPDLGSPVKRGVSRSRVERIVNHSGLPPDTPEATWRC